MKTRIELPKDLKKETTRRVREMKKEFSGDPEIKLFPNDKNYDQIIAQVGIKFSSLCEHHLVSFHGDVSIAYIPNLWLTGLSKFARVVKKYLNPVRPTIQEKATQQITNHLIKALQPNGLMVIIRAEHDCIGYRGIKSPSTTITSAVYGSFRDNSAIKQEFLTLLPQRYPAS